MSSNGVMLQDYVPSVINNLTEEIWCAGAVIPAGKRVVLGHMRDGGVEITFTMGPMQDFIGKALVPPEVVGIEEPQRIPGVGFMPQGVAAMAVRSGRSPQVAPNFQWQHIDGLLTVNGVTSSGYDVTSYDIAIGGTKYSFQGALQSGYSDWHNIVVNNPDIRNAKLLGITGNVTLNNGNVSGQVFVRVGQHTNLGYMRITGTIVGESTAYAPSRGAIDQSAPLPPSSPSMRSPEFRRPASQWGGLHSSPESEAPAERPEGWPNTPGTGIFPYYSPAATREIAIPSYVPGQARPGQSRMGPVWPVGMPAAVASRRIRGFHGSDGLGAGGASAFTMTAANALNQELVTNNCAGCADMTSRLRQLTFAFKAAVATDTGMPAQNLNMSNMLAMTAYGPATDAALKLVLGAGTAYANGPCTDDAGNCLGNLSTPITPPAIQAVEQQFAQQIQTMLKQVAYLPQADIVHTLVQGFAALINRFAVELAKLPPVVVVSQPPATPPPAAPPATAPATGIPWTTFLVGGLIGSAVLGTGVLLYTHARRS